MSAACCVRSCLRDDVCLCVNIVHVMSFEGQASKLDWDSNPTSDGVAFCVVCGGVALCLS